MIIMSILMAVLMMLTLYRIFRSTWVVQAAKRFMALGAIELTHLTQVAQDAKCFMAIELTRWTRVVQDAKRLE